MPGSARERACTLPLDARAGYWQVQVRLRYEQQNLQRLQNQKAAGQQGLVATTSRVRSRR